MIRYTHQGQFTRPRKKIVYYHDRFFLLPTVLAENDPFLRRLYGVVYRVLDDHPYPETSADFKRRTEEIKQNIRDLNLSPDQHNFLRRLMSDTGVTLVSFFYNKNYLICFF
jgi:hypothetical protein